MKVVRYYTWGSVVTFLSAGWAITWGWGRSDIRTTVGMAATVGLAWPFLPVAAAWAAKEKRSGR